MTLIELLIEQIRNLEIRKIKRYLISIIQSSRQEERRDKFPRHFHQGKIHCGLISFLDESLQSCIIFYDPIQKFTIASKESHD